MKTTFLIDGDNISVAGLNGLEVLQAEDEVIILNNSRVSYSKEVMKNLYDKCRCKIIHKKLPVAYKNSVDFAIAIELGELNADLQNLVVVISRDSDLAHIAEIYGAIYKKEDDFLFVALDVKHAMLQILPLYVDKKDRLQEIYRCLYGKKMVPTVLENMNNIFSVDKREEPKEQKKPLLFSLEKLKGR